MPIIGIVNQKGGVGKTTLATNLAHAFALDGEDVLLVDADPQGSSRDWNEMNEGRIVPVVGLDRETLRTDLKAVGKNFDWIFIDGAPQVAKLAAVAVTTADIILCPVQPSPYDIWACGDLVELIKARQEVTNGQPKAAFVISRAIKRTRVSGEVRNALLDYGLPVFESRTTQKVFYAESAASGDTVLSEPSHKAALEILEIKRELEAFANGFIKN